MITEEMRTHFLTRTRRHIQCVIRNLKHLSDLHTEFGDELLNRGNSHDQSKYKEPELTPYIYVSWKYKCESEGTEFIVPSDIEELMTVATEHHINNNSHHPEYWSAGQSKINPDDRDSIPDVMIDGTQMDVISLAEMACDWHAVAIERGGVNSKKWADDNVNKRWKFTDEQVKLLYGYISDLETQTIFESSIKDFLNKELKEALI